VKIKILKTYRGVHNGKSVTLYPGDEVDGELAEYVNNLHPDWCERIEEQPSAPAKNKMMKPAKSKKKTSKSKKK